MNQYTIKDFGKIIKHNAQSQRHELLPNGTNVFRIYDRNQEDFPVTVDLYSNYARVQVYSDTDLEADTKDIITDQINRMAYIDTDKIIFSYKAKMDKGQQHEKTSNEALIVNVAENNLIFKTDLTTYTDTGLFLDHVNTRTMIAEMSAGMNVLNLFSYTGAFSVYAASGLASKVTSVDLSATYTKWAEDNLKANGFEGDNYPCICCDAGEFVQKAILEETKFDIIIFDPPSFSNSRKMKEDFDVQRDFYDWIRNLRSILSKNGMIMFSTNLGNFKIDKKKLRGFKVKETTQQLWADGFVKGRKGTTRSWLMAMDDNSLSLDWSEDKREKKEYRPAERERNNRDGQKRNRSFGEHKERRNYGERREYRDRKDRDFRDRDFRDRDSRGFGERRERRVYNRDYQERHGYRDSGDSGSEREFNRRSEYRDNRDFRDRRDFGERRNFRDRRDFGERRDFYNREQPDFRERRNNDRHGNESGFNRERKPRYEHSEYESKHRFSERRDKESGFDRSTVNKQRKEKPRREEKDKKPYGYDAFKPARSRDDSADFFWNED